MITKQVVITNASGLHARPASVFVSEAKKFSSRLTIVKGGTPINGKSIIAVLGAGITCGTEIELQFDGDDEAAAAEALCQSIASGLGE